MVSHEVLLERSSADIETNSRMVISVFEASSANIA